LIRTLHDIAQPASLVTYRRIIEDGSRRSRRVLKILSHNLPGGTAPLNDETPVRIAVASTKIRTKYLMITKQIC